MSIFSSYKKIFLLGFIIVILLAIPLSVYIGQQRQETQIQATPSTILSLEPANPTVKVGETLILNVMLDPGAPSPNQVSFVKFSITFDATKFTKTTDGETLYYSPNSASSPNTLTTILEGPTYEAGKAFISLSIGADPTKAVVTKTKIAVLRLKATAPTSSIPVSFGADAQVLSIADSDGTGENVLSTTEPANIIISSATGATPTTAPSNPTPTTAPGQAPAPTLAPKSSPFGSINAGTGGGISSVGSPVCSNLNVNSLATGIAPYTLTFTATGSDSDGTINKISFNFGDSIEDLTSGGGIGTSTVSGQISHTYTTPGAYAAYAILTDNDGNLSDPESCTVNITVNSSLGADPNSPIIVQEPLPPTGNGEIMMGIGVLGAIFTIIGGALFFLL